jgi:hypothetical protein
VYLTALGVITGTTIYVVDNQRRHIKPEDIIQLPLAIAERCLATQTGTNSQGQPVYAVNPPSFVRTWKDTNGVNIVVTNTIGWHTDRAMMVSLDTTIQQLCPYYVDTNSVYDGTTNIVMNTFTGLLVKLGIGNGTNFTRTPAAYTPNNVATYGDYPWQIYVEDLQERYKVLNAMKMSRESTTCSRSGRGASYFMGTNLPHTWTGAKDDCENRPPDGGYNTQTNNPFPYHYFEAYTAGIMDDMTYATNYYATMVRRAGRVGRHFNPTNLTYTANLYLQATNGPFEWGSGSGTEVHTFDDFGDGVSEIYELQQTRSDGLWFNIGNTNYPAVPWCNEPTRVLGQTRGYSIHRWDVFYNWQFNYCTEKYW